MKRAPETCILCQTPERELLIRQDNWNVYRCPTCELGFLDPRPSENEIERLYREAYFSEQYDKGIGLASPEYPKRLRGETHRTRFIKSVKPSGRLLDIGCGYGYFLAACREAGYDAEGTDVSEWAAQHAAENLNISVAVGKINDIHYDFKCFDIITMWHFLEHSPDPHLVLRKVRTWLKPDGILVVDVPNYNGTDARYKWEGWVGWQLPYHYWHFTFNSLKLLLYQHGFRILKHKNYHSEVVKENLKRIPIVRLFARLIAKRYSGTSVAVIAKLER